MRNSYLSNPNTHKWIEAVAGALAILISAAPVLAATPVFQSLHSFVPEGCYPRAPLLRSGDDFYGTTSQTDKLGSHGTIYKIDSAGSYHTVHVLDGHTAGSHPEAGLVQDALGNLYGSTTGGGWGFGTLFKIDGKGSISVIHQFDPYPGKEEGTYPHGLIMTESGMLYGVTDGSNGVQGTLFQLDTTTLIFKTLHRFRGDDGGAPAGPLVMDGSGNLIGTTFNGGLNDKGTIFKIDPTGVLTTLHHFGGTDGRWPSGGLFLDSNGHAWGTTRAGGSKDFGTVFDIDAHGHHRVVYSFGDTDGHHPFAGLVPDGQGAWLGTTIEGGLYDKGTVFKLSASGEHSILHHFNGTDGSAPLAELSLDGQGNLLGTTFRGGVADRGLVFKFDANLVFHMLHEFGVSSGTSPYGGVVEDAGGNLFGTTFYGGIGDLGTVYKLDSAGSYSVLRSFGSADGTNPFSGLLLDDLGNLYGTSGYDGPNGAGTVYKIDAAGTFGVLHSFAGTDGAKPKSDLTRDDAGNLYGTTFEGGSAAKGTAFKLSPQGRLDILHHFTGTDGAFPASTLVLDDSGSLYGTSTAGGTSDWGTVFKLDANHNLTTLYDFPTLGDPFSSLNFAGAGELVMDRAGNLFGTFSDDISKSSTGGVFKIGSDGASQLLHYFSSADGRNPQSRLALDEQGNLYGAAPSGGQYGGGTLFKIDSTGKLQVLHDFKGLDGANPRAGLNWGANRSLIGTTVSGGTYDAGTVFRLTLPALTATALTSGRNPAPEFRPIAFSARVSGGTPTGTVTFLEGDNILETATLDSRGSATAEISHLAYGEHVITARYDGDDHHETSFSPPVIQIMTDQNGNRIPIAVDDDFTVVHDGVSPVALGDPGVLANGSDPDQHPLVVGGAMAEKPKIYRLPGDKGSVALDVFGRLTYIPKTTKSAGREGIAYWVSDGHGGTDWAQVGLTILRAPRAKPDIATTAHGQSVTFDLIGNDQAYDGATIDPSSLTISLPPSTGTVSTYPDGTVTYVPSSSHYPGDGFSYSVKDSKGSTAKEANVTVIIAKAYDRGDFIYVANAARTQVVRNSRVTALTDAQWPKGWGHQTVQLVSGPTCVNGSCQAKTNLKLNPNGTFRMTLQSPNSARTKADRRTAKVGTYRFTYVLTVNGVTTDPGVVDVRVD